MSVFGEKRTIEATLALRQFSFGPPETPLHPWVDAGASLGQGPLGGPEDEDGVA